MNIIYEYKWYILAIIIFTALTVFVWAKAITAVRRTAAGKRALILRLDRYKYLRDTYLPLDDENIKNIPPQDLADAVVVEMWQRLDGIKDTKKEIEEFEKFTLKQKYTYGIFYLCEYALGDGEKNGSLKSFFEQSTPETAKYACGALEAMGLDTAAGLMKKAIDAYDPENEEASLDMGEIENLSRRLRAELTDPDLKIKTGEYYKS